MRLSRIELKKKHLVEIKSLTPAGDNGQKEVLNHKKMNTHWLTE